jgi:hypothetical protein
MKGQRMKPKNRLRLHFRDAESKWENLHLRDIESSRFAISEHPLPVKFLLFFEKKVLPLIELPGYNLDAKRHFAMHMVHALIMAQKRNRCVADSRDTSDPDVRLRIAVWDAICEAGLAIMARGSESSGKTTRYAASEKLIKLRKRWGLESLVDLDLKRNSELDRATPHGLVYLHTGRLNQATGEPLPSKHRKVGIEFKCICTDEGLAWIRNVEDTVEAFNRNNLQHTWMFVRTDHCSGRQYSEPLNPCLRQIHCGAFHRAVRFYSWSELSGQSLSKAERKTILIDNEQVAELDYSASQIRMLYHLRGLDPKGDLYRLERVLPTAFAKASKQEQATLREFVKRATLLCLNVKSQKRANSSVGHSLKELEPQQRKYVRRAVREIEETDFKGVVERIVNAHNHPADSWKEWNGKAFVSRHGIAYKFFQESGLEMMTVESNIMRVMLQAFTNAKKPALMIHDAVVCKVSDVEFTKSVMTVSYQNSLCTDFLPVVKRAF